MLRNGITMATKTTVSETSTGEELIAKNYPGEGIGHKSYTREGP